MELTIRSGAPEDIDALVKIFRACWQESYRDILSEEVRADMTVEKATRLWLPGLTSVTDRQTLVACLENIPIGMARIGSDPDLVSRGHLFSLYIDPKYAGKGYGKVLLSTSLTKLAALGFNEISLWVFKKNLGASGLYKKMGFTLTQRERMDIRWQSPEVEMVHDHINSLL